MTLEELLAVAEIVEKLTNRYRDQDAAHKTALAELRASCNARTASDEHRLENLREEIIRLNDANGRLLVERDTLREEVAALKSQTPKRHPVKVGEWVRRTDAECDGIYFGRGVIAQVLDILDAPENQYTVSRPEWNGYTVPWAMQYCEPCDPPQTEPVPKLTHPVAVGGYLRRLTGFNTTPAGEVARVTLVDDDDPSQLEYEVMRPNGQKGRWSAKGCEPCDPPETTHDTPEGKDVAESVIRDGRKTEPKPGDTVRLVRIPSRDVVSPELQKVLEWPWIERWGTLNQTALVVEPAYQLDGAVAVCLSTNVHARWPINCLEVVTEAMHDTETGKAAAESALKTEPVAEEIKVGDLVMVFQATGSMTDAEDIGSGGVVHRVDVFFVWLDRHYTMDLPRQGVASLSDVRKVTT